jgi:hypothetical protein
MSRQYDFVVTPYHPNLDKLFAVRLLEKFSDLLSRKFGWEVFCVGGFPDDKTWRDYPNKCFIDCAGSPYDGHGDNATKSATLLVAENLGITGNPAVSMLVEKVHEQDKVGRKFKDELASVVVTAYRVGKSLSDVRDWTNQAIDAIIVWESDNPMAKRGATNPKTLHPWRSMLLHCIAGVMEQENDKEWLSWGKNVLDEAEVLREKAREEISGLKVREIQTWAGPKKLLIFQTENPFSGNEAEKIVDLVVCKNKSGGYLMISASGNSGLHLQAVAYQFRLAEAQKRGIKPSGWLSGEGTHPDLLMWHVHEKSNFSRIYNGTEHHCAVEPTLLTGKEILNAIKKGLKPRH